MVYQTLQIFTIYNRLENFKIKDGLKEAIWQKVIRYIQNCMLHLHRSHMCGSDISTAVGSGDRSAYAWPPPPLPLPPPPPPFSSSSSPPLPPPPPCSSLPPPLHDTDDRSLPITLSSPLLAQVHSKLALPQQYHQTPSEHIMAKVAMRLLMPGYVQRFYVTN